MVSSDFYLAASAVLPILVFADTIQGRQIPPFRLKSEWVVTRLNRDIHIVLVIGGLTWWPFYGWAEWISIRSLQIGHPAFGGSTAVWVALALAFVQLAGSDIAFRIALFLDSRPVPRSENPDGAAIEKAG